MRDCSALYYTGSMTHIGGAHKARNINGQDHAVALACRQGIVLAVSDGVSIVDREHSRAEVGAWLTAELAAAAALAALQRGAEPGEIKGEVAAALVAGLGPLWARLGRRAHAGLTTTLVLLVLTPSWTQVWASGDGCWGLLTARGARLDLLRVGGGEVRQVPGAEARGDAVPGNVATVGQRHLPRLFELASTEAARDLDAVLAQLQCVLSYGGQAVGAYVATDGLRDEPALEVALRAPCTSRARLTEQLQRASDSDDLGVAWCAERFPGLIMGGVAGLGALDAAIGLGAVKAQGRVR